MNGIALQRCRKYDFGKENHIFPSHYESLIKVNLADMRIHDMNAILEANRKQIMEKHNPGENDLYVRTLELAQVSE